MLTFRDRDVKPYFAPAAKRGFGGGAAVERGRHVMRL